MAIEVTSMNERPASQTDANDQQIAEVVLYLLRVIETAPTRFQGTIMCSLFLEFLIGYPDPTAEWIAIRDKLNEAAPKLALVRQQAAVRA